MRKVLLLSAAMLMLGVHAASAQFALGETVEIPAARTAAIGGTHVALADDLTSLFSNPAGFAAAGPELSIAELTLGLGGRVFSLADFILQVMGGADPLTLLTSPSGQKLFSSLYAAGSLNGPLALGYVGHGLGFGFFNTSRLALSTVGTLPTATAELKEDLVFSAGYAFSIALPARNTIDIGFMIKTFVEGSVTFQKSTLEMLSLISSFDPNVLIDQPLSLNAGAGLDLGIRYSWNDLLSFGIVGRNLPTFTLNNAYPSIVALSTAAPVTTVGYVPVDLSAGIMVTPGPVKIFLDYDDILDFWLHPDTAANWVLHIGIGAELTWQVFSLRAGFAQGHFAGGLGLDLSFMQLDLALFGQELSLEPGLRSAFGFLFGLRFKV